MSRFRRTIVTPPRFRGGTALFAAFALVAAFSLAGCILPGSDTHADDISEQVTPTPTVTLVPTGSGEPSRLEGSLAYLRDQNDPASVRGSAVVVGSNGLLITTNEAASANAELVTWSGDVFRPVILARQPEAGLALIQIPATRLNPVRFSTVRLDVGSEIYAAGFDSSLDSIGQMGGTVSRLVDSLDVVPFRVRGPDSFETDIPHIIGFMGGALVDAEGGFAGILVPGEDDAGVRVIHAISNWYVLGWLDERQERRERLEADAASWSRIQLPDGWTLRYPEGWGVMSTVDEADRFRGEFVPGDIDAMLQIELSVDRNSFGIDPEAFFDELFSARANALLRSIGSVDDRPLVRVVVEQEGAVVDLAYVLDEDYLIALSMTSGYRLADDPDRAERAREIFDTVLGTLTAESD